MAVVILLDERLTWLMILTIVSIEVGFPWSAVPEHWIAMTANVEPILEAKFRSRVNPCVLEVNVSKGREFESSHLPDHVGDGLDDLEVLGAGHAVPTATELNAGDMFHEYVLASDVI